MSQDKSTFRLGYWLCMINVVLGALYFGLAMLVLVIPQGWQIGTNGVHIVILLIMPWMILEWVMIHYTAPKEKRVFTLGSWSSWPSSPC